MKRTDLVILSLPLAVAIVNPGSGVVSGFGFTLLALLYYVLRYGIPRRIEAVDVLGVVAAAYVLLSQFWAYSPLESGSPSRGAAAVLLYFVVCRQLLTSPRDLRLFATVVAGLTSIYGLVFVVTADVYDEGASTLGLVRESVTYANANYAASIFSFGAVLSAWVMITASGRTHLRLALALGFTLQVAALWMTGSRAGLAGFLLGCTLLLAAPAWRIARAFMLFLLPLVFVMSLGRYTDSWFIRLAETLDWGRYDRGEFLYTLSGRDEVWYSIRAVASENWLYGSGLEGYRLKSPVPVLAHGWGLEFVAAVGFVGAALLLAMTLLSFGCWGSGARRGWRRSSSILNAATAAALIPSLALSTHQWTLWAWMGIALWSRAYLADESVQDSSGSDPQGEAHDDVKSLGGHGSHRAGNLAYGP